MEHQNSNIRLMKHLPSNPRQLSDWLSAELMPWLQRPSLKLIYSQAGSPITTKFWGKVDIHTEHFYCFSKLWILNFQNAVLQSWSFSSKRFLFLNVYYDSAQKLYLFAFKVQIKPQHRFYGGDNLNATSRTVTDIKPFQPNFPRCSLQQFSQKLPIGILEFQI